MLSRKLIGIHRSSEHALKTFQVLDTIGYGDGANGIITPTYLTLFQNKVTVVAGYFDNFSTTTIDVSNPSSMTLVNQTSIVLGSNDATAITTGSSGLACVTAMGDSHNVYFYDISASTDDPTYIYTNSNSNFNNVAMTASTAFVTASAEKVYVLNISDPFNITTESIYTTSGINTTPYGIVIKGDNAYMSISSTDEVKVLNISNTSSLVEVDNYANNINIDNTRILSLSGDILLVASTSGKVSAFDISVEDQITYISTIDISSYFSSFINDLASNNVGIAYVSGGSSGDHKLLAIDFSNPVSMFVTAVYQNSSVLDNPIGITCDDNYVYVSGNGEDNVVSFQLV